RNCLFLATKDETLVQAAGLIDLWSDGYVEPIVPPCEPYHILAQQLMALALQERGLGRRDWRKWIGTVPAFSGMPEDRIDQIVEWMLQHEILWNDQGILWLGREGENRFGRRNFLELFSVFVSPPLFSVRHGRQELGFVDELTFLGRDDGPRILLLAGRSWLVNHVDWRRKTAYVEAADAKGRSRWKGEADGLSYRLCQAIKRVLAADDPRDSWSRRARQQLAAVRTEFPWVRSNDSAVLIDANGATTWWTFGGFRANATIAGRLRDLLDSQIDFDSFTLNFATDVTSHDLEHALNALGEQAPDTWCAAIDPQAIDGLKFSECIPADVATAMLSARVRDVLAIASVLRDPIRFVHDSQNQ
ncbi:MAG: DEAD/DEAH box helicase, partial [Planctomycetota bacterium]